MFKLFSRRFGLKPLELPRFCSSSSKENLPDKPPQKNLEKKPYNPHLVTKEEMQWRTEWHKEESKYFNTLRVFYTEDNNMSLLQTLHAPINLSPSSIKAWWKKKHEEVEISSQTYLPERQRTLGNELAAAHFIVYRGGAVKFHGEDRWIKADHRQKYVLPRQFDEDKVLEAIDCSNMNLHYEGLSNFNELQDVQWLSFNGCDYIDDWCLDKIADVFSHSLVYLDLRNCKNISERGVGALYKMDNLKILYLDNFMMNTYFEMTCLLLQEVHPYLDIRSDEPE